MYCSGIQKQIRTSSAARKLIALLFLKISFAYMEAKRIYEVLTRYSLKSYRCSQFNIPLLLGTESAQYDKFPVTGLP